MKEEIKERRKYLIELIYEVRADNRDEALDKVKEGDGDLINEECLGED